MVKTTVSVIKADVGSIAGHTCPTQEMLEYARKKLSEARDSRIIRSYYVYSVGDDIGLVMTHDKGEDNAQVHELAWNVFKEITEKVSKPLKLYAAGQDLLKDAFSGTVKGMGPGVAELEFEERGSDPIVVFAADKTSPAAWNLILYRIFADPFNTAGLVIDPILHDGFIFEVMDLRDGRIVRLKTPEETYDLLSLIGTINRYVISRVYRARDNEPAASASTTRLSYIAGKYVGKDDPVLIVRAQSGFPAIGEILSAFAIPHLVPGWMRGSHYGPLMPVSFKKKQNIISYFDGPPRVIAMGWQISDGMLVGVEGNEPVDLFEDPVWDYSRELATKIAFYMRSMGEVMPARVELEEMEYTTLPKVLEKLKERFITTLK
ncbi:MAG: fructose-1,6-bisphosphatase [Thaumarchaeota archaeon]|jgi:fructose 1,6-bisphosphate aldolase/phosphatase|nr:fructose-1,6-bisphosphatase [Candidatus Geocrenenecus arthurdayi]MCL7390741.1 fructose-1,6-bisphosphatase [Candidatus Geocrenenecus arthurdayi]MCL7396629.1 fructose-1,6-bisphosphatase [Candidatus Geocrenenecus arthurdayi]MCL7402955.1 fructose-1,6-bisphosphatase [Candidatus Geocrenenecus arthurdayi]